MTTGAALQEPQRLRIAGRQKSNDEVRYDGRGGEYPVDQRRNERDIRQVVNLDSAIRVHRLPTAAGTGSPLDDEKVPCDD